MMNHTDRAAKAAPKSGHVRCYSPCLLWAKSGHCGASGLNANDCRRRHLFVDLALCWLRAAQSLSYRAGARLTIAFLVDL